MPPANREPITSPNELREKGVHRGGVERARGAQRPREGPAPLGETQTPEIGVQPRTTTGMPTPQVRNQSPVQHHHTQQSGSRRLGPAPHAGPDWLGGPHSAAAPDLIRAGVDRPPTAGHHDSSAFQQRAENRHWSPAPQRAGPGPRGTPPGRHHCEYRSSTRSAGQPTWRSAPPCRWPGTAGSRGQ